MDKFYKSIYSRKESLNRNIFLMTLNEEKLYYRIVIRLIIPIFISFSIVDSIVANDQVYFYVTVRVVASLFSIFLFTLSRGRVEDHWRKFFAFAPFLFSVELIMIVNNIFDASYFLGLGLLLFPSAIFVPLVLRKGLTLYSLALMPILISLIERFYLSEFAFNNIVPLFIVIGLIVLCSICSDQVFRETLKKIDLELELKKDLKLRNKKIREKVKEISRRRDFEKQFSPEVISEVLENENYLKEMKDETLVTTVYDIRNSTSKASSLPINDYKEVVEEIFDIINEVSLSYNITVDKFTGDGVQVFAGSPKKRFDDLERSILAATEVLKKINFVQNLLMEKWKDNVEVSIGICKGNAIVGFLGKGNVKSFTAIGLNISLTHRICSKALPNEILIYSPNELDETNQFLSHSNIKTSIKKVNDMKGIQSENMKVISIVKPLKKKRSFGICEDCGGELVLDSLNLSIICDFCDSSEKLEIAS